MKAKFLSSLLVLLLLLGITLAAIFSNVYADYSEVRRLDIPLAPDITIVKDIDLHENILSTPRTSKNIVYVQTRSKITALDGLTYKIVWESSIKGRNFNSPMALTNNTVIASSANGAVIALDAMTGSILWNTPASDYTNTIEDIKAQSELVFIATSSNNLESRRLRDGALQWSVILPQRSQISLLPVNNVLLMNSDTGQLTAFNSINGSIIWTYYANIKSYIYSDTYNLLIVVEEKESQQFITAMELESGNVLWSIQVKNFDVNCARIDQKDIYLSGDTLLKFDIEAKTIVWENRAIDDLTCPITINNKIYVKKSIRDLYIYDQHTGNLEARYALLWSLTNNTNIQPVSAGDNLIVIKKPYTISFLKINSQ